MEHQVASVYKLHHKEQPVLGTSTREHPVSIGLPWAAAWGEEAVRWRNSRKHPGRGSGQSRVALLALDLWEEVGSTTWISFKEFHTALNFYIK